MQKLLALLVVVALACPARAATEPYPGADLMTWALDAIYVRHDYDHAVGLLRSLLSRHPGHYGATFQLAKALELDGKADLARDQWEASLRMAEACGDRDTVRIALAHLPPMPVLEIDTTAGLIRVRVKPARAPLSAASFLARVDEHFYDGTVFHRTVPGFMVQGGGVSEDGTPKPDRPAIKLESTTGLRNIRGSLAMARTNDPDSGGTQFFINVSDNWFLDGNSPKTGYAVFGEVVEGMDVVDKIVNAPRRDAESPVQPVVIRSIRRSSPAQN